MQKNNSQEKIPFLAVGTVHSIGEEKIIKRDNKANLRKVILTIETEDGQVLYPELRNNRMKQLKQNNIQEKSVVTFSFTFQGSSKNDKLYNNIYIHNIEIWEGTSK